MRGPRPGSGGVDRRRAEVVAGYDAVAALYADHVHDELRHKPFDRDWLDRLAALTVGAGPLCDLGCGAGHVAGYLDAGGAEVFGADLAPTMLREAHRLHPGIRFERQDMLALTIPAGSLGGIVAFYAIVHFSPAQVGTALRECWRALRPGGSLLLAFHVGDGVRHVAEFLGQPVSLDFVFFQPDEVGAHLVAAGFEIAEVTIRDPYPAVEYPSRRAYVLARKPARTGVAGGGDQPAATT